MVALSATSSDGGQTLVGTMTYAGEGPIGFRATMTGPNTYAVENQWGGTDAPWNPGGTWVIGRRDAQSVVAIDILSEDGGSTLNGTMTYDGEGPIGFRAVLMPSPMAEEPASSESVTTGTAASDAAIPAASAAPAQADRFPLLPGQTIVREQKVPSESGNHYLIFQPDGNVVVYTADDQYVWGLQSITDEYAQAQSVQMENDGNFVVRDANGEHIWSALTENPDPSAYLTLTTEGVLRLVSGDTGAILWASDGVTSLP